MERDTSSLRMRQAGPADAAAVAALHAESWRAHYRGAYRDAYLDGEVFEDRLRVWRKRLSRPAPDQLVVLAEQGEELIGFACAYAAADPAWGSLLDNLHVRSAHQGRGIGERLVAEVAAWCRERHPGGGLYLWVLQQNQRARRFYARLGARDCGGEHSEPPGGGRIHGRRYAWAEVPDLVGGSLAARRAIRAQLDER